MMSAPGLAGALAATSAARSEPARHASPPEITETNGVTGNVTLRWTVSNACGSSLADVVVQVRNA